MVQRGPNWGGGASGREGGPAGPRRRQALPGCPLEAGAPAHHRRGRREALQRRTAINHRGPGTPCSSRSTSTSRPACAHQKPRRATRLLASPWTSPVPPVRAIPVPRAVGPIGPGNWCSGLIAPGGRIRSTGLDGHRRCLVNRQSSSSGTAVPRSRLLPGRARAREARRISARWPAIALVHRAIATPLPLSRWGPGRDLVHDLTAPVECPEAAQRDPPSPATGTLARAPCLHPERELSPWCGSRGRPEPPPESPCPSRGSDRSRTSLVRHRRRDT